jgi:hypothetical protein
LQVRALPGSFLRPDSNKLQCPGCQPPPLPNGNARHIRWPWRKTPATPGCKFYKQVGRAFHCVCYLLAASLLPSRFQRCWATSTGGRAKRVAEPREKTRAGRESHTPCFGRGARFLRNASRSASVRASPYEHLCTLGRSFALPARLCAPRRKRDAPAIDRQDGFSKTAVVWCNG